MVNPRILTVALLLSAIACADASNVAGNAKISISGSFSRADGTPVGDVPVRLYREADIGEGFAAFASLGLSCAGDDRKLAACSHGDDTQTGDDGRFTYALKGSDTQGSFGNAATLELTGTLGRGPNDLSGPATTIRFQVQTTALQFPLRFWEPKVAASVEGLAGRIEYDDPPADVAPSSVDLAKLKPLVVFGAVGGTTLWQTTPAGRTATFDARVLEDASGGVSVLLAGRTMPVPDNFGRKIDLIVRSARKPFRGPYGAPPSRGAVCHVPGAGPLSPCLITDGDFSNEFRPPASGPSATPPAHTVISFANPIAVSLIVVRGCRESCIVELSGDNKTWTRVATAGAAFAALPVTGTPKARYARVSGGISSLTEVSVWNDPPSRPPASIIADASKLIPRDRNLTPIIIAGLLVALGVGLGAGLLLRRRASTPQ